MRYPLKVLAAALSVLAIFAALAGFAQAQDIKERTFKVAFLPTDDHPIGLGAKRFADLVAEKSGGKMKVRLFASGQLGGDLQVISALQGGTVEMTILVTSLLAGDVKDFTLLDAPFLFNAGSEADAVLDGPVGQKLLAKMSEKGLVGLGYFEYGFRHFLNSRRPVQKVEDLQGLKIRVSQTPVFIEFINSLGANATPMPIPELYTALEQGRWTAWIAFVLSSGRKSINEVQKHLVLTSHIYNPQASWSASGSGTASRRRAEGAPGRRPRGAGLPARGVARAGRTELEALKKTMQITEMPQADIAKMREKAKPIVEKHYKEIDQTLVEGLQAELKKLRGKTELRSQLPSPKPERTIPSRGRATFALVNDRPSLRLLLPASPKPGIP